jgi:hypothetical protein
MMENYSLSDIRAVTDDGYHGDMFSGNGAWWIIILFLFMFGNGSWGGNRSNEIQQGFDTAEITRKLDGLANGLCDGFYAQNTTMLNGFAGVTAAVEQARFDAQKCCCETNRNIDAVRYDAQKNTCDITTAIHAEGEATRGLITQNTMQALRDKLADKDRDIQTRDFQLSQLAQNAYLVNTLNPAPIPAYAVANPKCCQ